MLKTVRLDSHVHNRAQFDCGVDEINRFLREQASYAASRFLSRTRIVADSRNPSEILGFYTLAYTEVTAPEASRLYRRYPHPLPALLLARMGVDKRYQRRRLGEQMLLEAIFQVARVELESLAPAPVIGLLVDAFNAEILPFYAQYGFMVADPKAAPLRLWLPIAACVDVFRISHGE